MTAWQTATLDRYRPPGLRPGAAACWCCGNAACEYKPGWFECVHPEGPVRWYGGAAPLALSNGTR
jgi:hypothetical protein